MILRRKYTRHDLSEDNEGCHWGKVLLWLWPYFPALFLPTGPGWVKSDPEPIQTQTSDFSLRWKRRCLPCTVQQPRQTRLAHSPNPLIFPKTNYPGVRDLTHKFRTAGEFSDFNHTSMPVPLNNLHCLSLAPALFQLCIDYYPASALCCDPAPPAVPLTLCPRGARKTASRSLGSREQSAGVMICSWNCHWFCDMLMPSLSLSGERNERIVRPWQSGTGVCRTMPMASGVKPRWSINS